MTLKEFTVLSTLSDRGGAGQRELGEAMLLDANSISILLTGLEDRGLLTRTPDRADRRRYWVTLTDAGAAGLRRAETAMGEAGAVVLGSLTAAERSQLRHLVAKALETPNNQ
jgi:DNA-binding MarR family transcriptional regulator